MSHVLYSTCLMWSGRRGVAKLHGRCVELHAPPYISGAPVLCVEYVPEVDMRRIRMVGEAERGMEDHEVREADATLRAVVAPAG